MTAVQPTGNVVWPPDGTPRNGSTTPNHAGQPQHDGLVILSPEASAALQALRERARQHEPAAQPTVEHAAEPERVHTRTPMPLPPPPQPVVVAAPPEPQPVAMPQRVQLADDEPVSFDQAISEARAEAAAVVAAARAQAVSLLADAVAEIRDERGAVVPAPVTVVLDPDTFARAFAVAIAAVLEQRPDLGPSGGAAAPPGPPTGTDGRQIIDLGADFISPHQALQFQIQQAQALQAARQAGALWPTQPPAPAKSFWSNAWHPDVLLSAVAMIIVLIVLVAFAA